MALWGILRVDRRRRGLLVVGMFEAGRYAAPTAVLLDRLSGRWDGRRERPSHVCAGLSSANFYRRPLFVLSGGVSVRL